MAKTKEGKPALKLVNVELPADVHRMLKVACAARDLNFSQGVEQAVRAWAKAVAS